MTGQYLGNDLQWRPIATVSGGGPVERLPLDASLGAASGPALAKAVGDEIWDYYEPFVGGANLSYAFWGMSGITTVPLFDTSSVTSMASVFSGCSSLTTVPLLNTGAVKIMSNMFNGCSSLTEIPDLDTGEVTDMNNTFIGCSSLTEVPAFDMGRVTTGLGSISRYGGIFGASGMAAGYDHTYLYELTRFRAYGATRGFSLCRTSMSADALNELMENLGTASGSVAQTTLRIANNPGSATCDPTIATAKGWTVVTA